MKKTLFLPLLFLGSIAMGDGATVDPKIPSYKPAEGVSGTIKSVGSDTMNNLMALWRDEFLRFYPGVTIEVEGKGSGTAPPALIEGTATFGPMSRPMKAEEADGFEKKWGYKPTGVKTSIDALAVFVHKDNPIKGLTIEQIDAIFSKTRKSGYAKDITTWGDLGLTGEWQTRPITLYGRNSASGTYVYFKEHALAKGDYKDSVKEQPGSSAVVSGVAAEKGAIGYSGIGYITADVRAVPIAAKNGQPFIEASPDKCYAGEYPLARALFVYVNYAPGTKLDALKAEFLRLVLSKQGQEVVVKDGYFPLPARIVADELRKVGLGEGRP
ncbi:MAG: PstS family phosphate ABC transporter substrate-binding protein [Planctomycetota bacterium]